MLSPCGAGAGHLPSLSLGKVKGKCPKVLPERTSFCLPTQSAARGVAFQGGGRVTLRLQGGQRS